MATDEAKARRADQELLELEVSADGRDATVKLSDIHLAPFGRMYGGAGTALASTAIEAATGRRLVWATTQFVGACGPGDRLDLRAEVLAAGRRTSQVHVRASVGSQLVFQALGAAGETDSDIPDGTVSQPPDVPPPAECPVMPMPPGPGFFGLAEQRYASVGAPRSHRWWIRLPGHCLARPALLGLAGDFVPGMVMRGIGEPGAGTSLDNTIRVGSRSAQEWILIDGSPEQATGGFGHGHVRLWAADGTLVGLASQSAALWRSLG
jgi:acyl-CoA thioesterase